MAASPFGIVYASEDEKADLTLPSAIATLNAEFSERIEQCEEDYTGQYDRVQVDASAIPNWTDILAVYAVKDLDGQRRPRGGSDGGLGKKLVLLRKICEEMTPLSATLRSEGEKTVFVMQLQLKTYGKWRQNAGSPTQEQRKMRRSSTLVWDAFLEANEPTKKTAPSSRAAGALPGPCRAIPEFPRPLRIGTARIIVARTARRHRPACAPWHVHPGGVKAGVVAKSTYNASYGNYVVLRHPDGTQTLYAHMCLPGL